MEEFGAKPLPHSAHPRRKATHESVSLRHQRRSPNTFSLAEGVPPVTSTSDSGVVLKTRQSSGETTNPDHWFEKSNDNLGKHNSSLAVNDNEPPFFLRDSSSYTYETMTLPTRPLLAHNTSNGSSAEEYRSVIDDLTIQNKKLKRKLKKLKNPGPSCMEGEKLFEVKLHGLPSEKKRELEVLLNKFMQGLSEPSRNVPIHAPGSIPSAVGIGATFKSTPSFSSTRVADSGYGSMTNSGKTSTPHSSKENFVNNALHASRSNEQNIRTYLSDIRFQDIVPKDPTVMTEREKKKLVVRRLEQIFGGRGAAPGLHQQSLQQQEVSRLAAKADEEAVGTIGDGNTVEGIREARIMDHEVEDHVDVSKSLPQQLCIANGGATQEIQSKEHVDEHDWVAHASDGMKYHEQRPTRPLDLDPQRAQIPQENVEYIRHLGFTLPDVQSAVDGEGWLYLNLLINMAQLHTLNVTPDFVKRSLSEYSTKLELSADGRKARWRGGEDVSRTTSSDSDRSPDAVNIRVHGSKRKRTQFAAEDVDSPMCVDMPPTPKRRVPDDSQNDKFSYRPLFPRTSTDSDNETVVSMDELSRISTRDDRLTKNSSGVTNATVVKRQVDGPIIYYKDTKFWTDLSGDHSGTSRVQQVAQYECLTPCPLGVAADRTPLGESRIPANTRPLLTCSSAPEHVTHDDSFNELDFEPARLSPKRVSFAEPKEPIRFEVSGIGGVYPADNYATTVLRQHFITPATTRSRSTFSKLDGILPPKPKSVVGREVIKSIQTETRPPSKLPPPSYTYDDDNSSDSEDSDDDDDDGMDIDNSEDISTLDNTKYPHRSHISSHSSSATTSSSSTEDKGNEAAQDDDDDEEEEGSLDFLADARAADPVTTRARERQYDADVAERLAEDIPAGSSAATANGGSACGSLIGGVHGSGEEFTDGDAYMGGEDGSVSS